jgi:hypothetical protein
MRLGFADDDLIRFGVHLDPLALPQPQGRREGRRQPDG